MIFNFKGEIETDEKTLELHSKDASVFRVLPSAVYYPKDVEDIQNLVKQVAEEKKTKPEVSLAVRAGGTCMSGGSLNTGYVMNMTRHMTAISIDPETLTVDVEMGAYFRDIEAEALKHGLMFAPYTSSHLVCGIGGMIGNNASGEKSVRYGATIDNVISLEVVLADGSLIKTHSIDTKDINDEKSQTVYDLFTSFGDKLKQAIGNVTKVSSGYRLERVSKEGRFDLMPLFVGAQGTLGIVTRAKLQLVPLPANTRLVMVSIDSIHDMPFILKTIMGHKPEGVETFDINTYKRAFTLMPVDGHKIQKYFHSNTTCVILAQFSEANQEKTDADAKACLVELGMKGISAEMVMDPEVAASAWRIRRVGYSVMCDHNEEGYRAVPCIEDVIVPIENFEIFIPRIVAILKKHSLDYGFHGHIGDGALRIIPVFNFNDPEVGNKIIAFTKDTFKLIKEVRGNTSADHGDGIVRSPFLKEFYGEELYGVFVKIKNLFDPEGIFNPHKKIGGSEELLKKWLDR